MFKNVIGYRNFPKTVYQERADLINHNKTEQWFVVARLCALLYAGWGKVTETLHHILILYQVQRRLLHRLLTAATMKTQIKVGMRPPSVCSRCFLAKCCSRMPGWRSGGSARRRDSAVIYLDDINQAVLWQVYKAQLWCLSLFFCVKVWSDGFPELWMSFLFKKECETLHRLSCREQRLRDRSSDCVIKTQRNVISTQIRSCFLSAAKSLRQGAVRPGVLPHEPHRGRLLRLGVPEPSKDDCEWGWEWRNKNGASCLTSLS